MNHPDILTAQLQQRQNDLLADADQHRMLRLARQWRKACRAAAAAREVAPVAASHENVVETTASKVSVTRTATSQERLVRAADRLVTTIPVAPTAVAAIAGTLAECGPHVAGSAR